MTQAVLTIAATDPSGGAGLLADLKTIAAHGCYGQGVITAITAQNSYGVRAVERLQSGTVTTQLASVFEDTPPAAVKIGAIPTPETVSEIANFLKNIDTIPIIIDPVITSSSGVNLYDSTDYSSYLELIDLATVATPNAKEAALLFGNRQPRCHLLITGGDQTGDQVIDRLVSPDGSERVFSADRHPGPSPHGTGCTLSSAIACNLALGANIVDAVSMAIRSTQALISHSVLRGGGPHKSLDHEMTGWVVSDRF